MSNVTILDVAKAAGVSPSTITHALNGKRPVSRETKERIDRIIKELGYIPSHSASHLRSGCSGIIGVYVVDITESFTTNIVRGIEQGLAGSGKSLLFASGVELGDDPATIINFFRTYDVDGLLVCNHLTENGEGSALFSSSNLPTVSINKEIDGVSSIIPDNILGGRDAAEYLLSKGMKRPAIIAGPTYRSSSTDRIKGFREKISEHGISMPDSYCCCGDYTFQHGYDSAVKLLDLDRQIDALFCANDFIASGAISALEKMGISIPDQVMVIGFDNRDFSAFWPIRITTFQQPLQEMGCLGMKMLLSMLNNPCPGKTECIRMRSSLIIRESTK